ncbi:unnamed protein product [Discosporangium mesarthrocarpum]
MENYISFLTLSTEDIGFTINTDIFETNIVNIILLLIILFIVLKSFLEENLGARKKQIIDSVEDAEKKLVNANERFLEAKKQWSQIKIFITDIQEQTKEIKKNIGNAELKKAHQDLSQKFDTALLIVRYRQQQMFNDVIVDVSEKSLKEVIQKLEKQLGTIEQEVIIDNKIKQLGEYL